MHNTTVKLTDNEAVAAMLDGLELLPCEFCGADCDVPDYVLAVVEHKGERRPIAVCDHCTDALVTVVPLVVSGGLAVARKAGQ